MRKIKKHNVIIFIIFEAVFFITAVINYKFGDKDYFLSDLIMYWAISTIAFFVTIFGSKIVDRITGKRNSRFRILFLIMSLVCTIFFGKDVTYDAHSLYQAIMPFSFVMGCLSGLLDTKTEKEHGESENIE